MAEAIGSCCLPDRAWSPEADNGRGPPKSTQFMCGLCFCGPGRSGGNYFEKSGLFFRSLWKNYGHRPWEGFLVLGAERRGEGILVATGPKEQKNTRPRFRKMADTGQPFEGNWP